MSTAEAIFSYNITEIAIYLRKSRGDDEEVLAKHKKMLIEYAEKYRLKYVLYLEVVSADSIAYRPKMQELLQDIKRGLFDATLVADYDRLCRGDKEDQAVIEKTFIESKTLILTPQKVYDLNNESDALLSDVQGLLARFEYQQIKKRFKRGKVMGAKMGHWTNGPAPFPYVYLPSQKKIVVDESKIFLYQEIKQRVISGESLASIRFDLNRRGYRTNKAKLWTENAIYRIMTNPTHLGHVVHGKTSGSGHKNKKTQPLTINPKENWITASNVHEAVMTEDEAVKIKEILFGNRIVPKKARKGIYPLSGLLRCGKCGYSINFTNNIKQSKTHYFLKKCNKPDGFGVRCSNPGVRQDLILEIIKHKLKQYESELAAKQENLLNNQNERLKKELKMKEIELKKNEDALNKIKLMYEENDYTRDEYMEQKEKRLKQILLTKSEIDKIKTSIQYNEKVTNEDRIQEIVSLNSLWDRIYCSPGGLMDEEGVTLVNRALKKIIEKIHYTRIEDDITVEINFL
ncbi:recombinase family protein [Paenibacillus frigoriresistens]|uniref:recombinase family protein n=1 Tax=Paenibacillus alginolyticus TaxID=59839 RepID=UPI001562F564|nr:recombinase family protein [Paenibacillus frigoriresistens]NRF89816.1 recombinase family protein [Paenibacillus frigoriresistens]